MTLKYLSSVISYGQTIDLYGSFEKLYINHEQLYRCFINQNVHPTILHSKYRNVYMNRIIRPIDLISMSKYRLYVMDGQYKFAAKKIFDVIIDHSIQLQKDLNATTILNEIANNTYPVVAKIIKSKVEEIELQIKKIELGLKIKKYELEIAKLNEELEKL